MKINLVKIGNSKGIRIPSQILKQVNFENSLQLNIIDNESIILTSAKKSPREGWNEKFSMMRERKEDKLIIPDETPSDFNDNWEW